jgi:hypothetical protein
VAKGSEKSNEFRRYRQVLTVLYIGTVSAGFLLLAASVAKELLFHTPVVGVDGPVLSPHDPDPVLLTECNDEVFGLFRDLGETTNRLLAMPPRGERESELASEWATFSREWQRRWDVVNTRCAFSQYVDAEMGTPYERMAMVHRDLPSMRLKYQSLLVRFEKEQAAELARMHRALGLSREGLAERAEQAREGAQRQ